MMEIDNNECDHENAKKIMKIRASSSAPPFLVKTYMLVEDPATDDVISWNDDGTGFVVWQTAEFARDLLPKLFKHSNFSSFVRQLNTYGFRKVATSRWEFSNDMFRRGGKDLLCEIRRKKAWSNKPQSTNNCNNNNNNNNNTQIIFEAKDHHNNAQCCDEDQKSTSTSSYSSDHYYYNCLVDENKRLKKENGVLSCELSVMKNKCKELLDLVTIYTTTANNKQNDHQDDADERVPASVRPTRGCQLFGVRLEVEEEG